LSPTMQQSTSKGRKGGHAEFNSDKQTLIGEGDDEGCRGELAVPVDEALPQTSNVSITQ
jgi:hypothetical protein